MDSPPSKSASNIASGFVVLVFVALCCVWTAGIIKGIQLVRARDLLPDSVARGDLDEVLALVDLVDPGGKRSAAEWTGRPELGSQSGFSWILGEWRRRGHAEAAQGFLVRWLDVDFEAAVEAFPDHIQWLASRQDEEGTEHLFRHALELAASLSNMEGTSHGTTLLQIAQQHPFLGLLAAEFFVEKGHTPPQDFVNAALVAGNFGSETRFDRLLGLVGLFEPVESFVLRRGPFLLANGTPESLLETLHRALATNTSRSGALARLRFIEGDYAAAGPQQPGLFLLKRLLRDSPAKTLAGLKAAEIAPALSAFSHLNAETKSEIAALIDRNVDGYGEERRLREWVSTHYGEAWRAERERLLDTDGFEEQGPWPPQVALRWVQAGARMGQSDEAAAMAMNLWKLRREGRISAGFFADAKEHPFDFLVPMRPAVGAKLATVLPKEPFALLVALGRDPDTPPVAEVPPLIDYRKPSGSFYRRTSTAGPISRVRAAQFIDVVVDLGEPFEGDPLRFLIVSGFRELVGNLSTALAEPVEIARFQSLAEKDGRPGSWLAKDLAELLPLWWLDRESGRTALLAAGGRCDSYERIAAYLADRQTPVAARLSFALEILRRDFTPTIGRDSVLKNSSLASLPEIDALVLEFAAEFGAGRWSWTEIDERTWRVIVDSRLGEASAGQGESSQRLKQEARAVILSRLEGDSRLFFDALRQLPENERRIALGRAQGHLASFAALLRLEARGSALAELWEEISGDFPFALGVFPWVTEFVRKGKEVPARRFVEKPVESHIGEGMAVASTLFNSVAGVGPKERIELVMKADPQLDLWEKVEWLDHDDTEPELASLLAREWRRLGEPRGASALRSLSGRSQRLPALAVGANHDLRFLLRIALSRNQPFAGLSDSEPRVVKGLVAEFVGHRFESGEMERHALALLPLAREEVHVLKPWLKGRIGEWQNYLNGEVASIRENWPYWAKWIEAHALLGEVEPLSEMVPDSWWLRGRSLPWEKKSTEPDGREPVEEIVWMSLARAAAVVFRHGEDRARLDAVPFAVRLLSALPSERLGSPGNLPNLPDPWRPNAIYGSAASELAMHAVGGILLASLGESREEAVERCLSFYREVPTSRTASPSRAAQAIDFLRLLNEMAWNLPATQRLEFLLRACETPPFNEGSIAPKPLPLFRTGKGSLPHGISNAYLVELAETRLSSNLDDPFSLADLGLVHHLAGNDGAALPLLKRAQEMLSPDRPGATFTLAEISACLERIAKRAELP